MKFNLSLMTKGGILLILEDTDRISDRLLFEQPYFITQHAISEFRRWVANLSAARIIQLVQAALQIQQKPAYAYRQRNGRLCFVMVAKYAGVEYGVPIVRSLKGEWPVVPTILSAGELRRDKERRLRECQE